MHFFVMYEVVIIAIKIFAAVMVIMFVLPPTAVEKNLTETVVMSVITLMHV